jgi:hypothetical protein
MTVPSSLDDLAARHGAALEEAALVAHDVNNLLLVIRGHCAVLAKRATDDVTRDKLQKIDEAAGGAGDLTRRLFALRDSA